jgi:hypothetical protein
MRTVLFLSLLAASASPTPKPAPSASPSAEASRAPRVILFLVDNSASLPPLDPEEKRVAALEKMFTFLQGQPYRLVLFGGRREIYVDDVARYNNRGQWTDFYFAFEKAREIVASYPPETEFRIILLTDAIVDPDPEDWAASGVPPGDELRQHSARRAVALLAEIEQPLYVILVGELPAAHLPEDPELATPFVRDMVQAANGALAAPRAQSLAAFFEDDGLLLKKFVYRVPPQAGLARIEPIVRRIVAPPSVGPEFQFLGGLVLPLLSFLFVMLGLLVRSFPGPGDVEILELSLGQPVHVAADRLHKVGEGGWGTTGLSLVGSARDAAATLTYQAPAIDLAGGGLDKAGLDELAQRLLPMGLEEMRRALDAYSDSGTKEEKIWALNLDYMAKNFDPGEAERILGSAPGERRRLPGVDFLRAKAHLLSNDALRRKLTEPRVHLVGYGRGAERKDLAPGGVARIGRYGFLVRDVMRGGRRDVRLVLYYDRVPSLLALKTILPDAFQRVFRMRRTSQRIVA